MEKTEKKQTKGIKAFWHGIKAVFTAVVDWVAILFGMKDNSKYGHVMRRIVGIVFAVGVTGWAATKVVYFLDEMDWGICDLFESDDNVYVSEQLSENLFFYDGYYGEIGDIRNAKGKKLVKNVYWIAKPLEGDSIVCYSDGSHRGYFHMRDGRLIVKPVYDHAWVFSEGLAAVEKDGRVQFINTEGNVAIDKSFAYRDNVSGYVFHQGHCAVHDSTGEKMGLIDHTGAWTIEPQYESISPVDTFWVVANGNRQAILTFGLDTLIPMTAASFEIRDTAIFATNNDHTQSQYNLQGKLLVANQIREVEQLMYDTREVTYRDEQHSGNDDEYYYTDEFYVRKAVATCLKYEAECGWYGLMTPDGRQLTPPSYYSIEAVDKDLYLCKTIYGHGVLFNGKGQRVE